MDTKEALEIVHAMATLWYDRQIKDVDGVMDTVVTKEALDTVENFIANNFEEDTSENKKPWTTFWFESNRICGYIDSPEEWERIKKAYNNNTELLSFCDKSPFPNLTNLPSYGLCREHLSDDNLGKFFKRNNMKM